MGVQLVVYAEGADEAGSDPPLTEAATQILHPHFDHSPITAHRQRSSSPIGSPFGDPRRDRDTYIRNVYKKP